MPSGTGIICQDKSITFKFRNRKEVCNTIMHKPHVKKVTILTLLVGTRHPNIAIYTHRNNNPFHLIKVIINKGLVETQSRIDVQAIGMEGLPILLLLEHWMVANRLKETDPFHLFDGVGDESSDLICSWASCNIQV